MVAEILELSRAGANSRKTVERLDPYLPVVEQLMSVLSEAMKLSPASNPQAFDAAFSSAFQRVDARPRVMSQICIKLENEAGFSFYGTTDSSQFLAPLPSRHHSDTASRIPDARR
jgi:hypothetical protein